MPGQGSCPLLAVWGSVITVRRSGHKGTEQINTAAAAASVSKSGGFAPGLVAVIDTVGASGFQQFIARVVEGIEGAFELQSCVGQ